MNNIFDGFGFQSNYEDVVYASVPHLGCKALVKMPRRFAMKNGYAIYEIKEKEIKKIKESIKEIKANKIETINKYKKYLDVIYK